MDTELSISVTIGDRNYKLRVNRDEEESIRKAVKIIEDSSKEYSKIYAYKDRQDLLAMLALEYVTSLLKLQEQEKFKNEGMIKKLEELDIFLSENLSK